MRAASAASGEERSGIGFRGLHKWQVWIYLLRRLLDFSVSFLRLVGLAFEAFALPSPPPFVFFFEGVLPAAALALPSPPPFLRGAIGMLLIIWRPPSC